LLVENSKKLTMKATPVTSSNNDHNDDDKNDDDHDDADEYSDSAA